jgi:hypothetical protein
VDKDHRRPVKPGGQVRERSILWCLSYSAKPRSGEMIPARPTVGHEGYTSSPPARVRPARPPSRSWGAIEPVALAAGGHVELPGSSRTSWRPPAPIPRASSCGTDHARLVWGRIQEGNQGWCWNQGRAAR